MRALKIVLLLCVIILFSLQFSGFHSKLIQQTRMKKQIGPFSFSRRMKWKCKKVFQKAFVHINYTYHYLKLEAEYNTVILMDNIRFLYIFATNKNIQTVLPSPPENKFAQNETYAELISTLSPYERKIADRLLLQWQDNSTKLSNYFVKKIKAQSEEWEDFVNTWNAPLRLPENQQPYHYQQDKMDQKLACLFLGHSFRMMNRNADGLYWTQYYQNLNFQFHDFMSSKVPYENRTTFHQIYLFLEFQRDESLYYTKMYLITRLYNTKKSVDIQLKNSFHALNESIHVEKGLYYDTLHPDNKYIINIRRTEYKVLSKKMRAIWIEWPRACMRQGEILNYWQLCRAILQRLWNICLYLSRKWHEIKRTYMRRLLHGYSELQCRLGSIRDYLFAG